MFAYFLYQPTAVHLYIALVEHITGYALRSAVVLGETCRKVSSRHIMSVLYLFPKHDLAATDTTTVAVIVGMFEPDVF